MPAEKFCLRSWDVGANAEPKGRRAQRFRTQRLAPSPLPLWQASLWPPAHFWPAPLLPLWPDLASASDPSRLCAQRLRAQRF